MSLITLMDWYKQRSPIESVDTLSCPILLLQGAEDKVVPPNQAEMMHKAVVKKGMTACLDDKRAKESNASMVSIILQLVSCINCSKSSKPNEY